MSRNKFTTRYTAKILSGEVSLFLGFKLPFGMRLPFRWVFGSEFGGFPNPPFRWVFGSEFGGFPNPPHLSISIS